MGTCGEKKKRQQNLTRLSTASNNNIHIYTTAGQERAESQCRPRTVPGQGVRANSKMVQKQEFHVLRAVRLQNHAYRSMRRPRRKETRLNPMFLSRRTHTGGAGSLRVVANITMWCLGPKRKRSCGLDFSTEYGWTPRAGPLSLFFWTRPQFSMRYLYQCVLQNRSRSCS
jgi:hypothetical protein